MMVIASVAFIGAKSLLKVPDLSVIERCDGYSRSRLVSLCLNAVRSGKFVKMYNTCA
jgi:hypothetical protein